MKPPKVYFFLILSIVAANFLAVFCLFWINQFPIGGFLSYLISFLLPFTLLGLFHPKLKLFTNESLQIKLPLVLAITIFYCLLLGGVYHYYLDRLRYKPYSMAELAELKPAYGYCKVNYTEVLYQKAIYETHYDTEDKEYSGDYLVPVVSNDSEKLQPWIYLTNSVKTKREADLINRFKSKLSGKYSGYFELASPIAPWVDFDEARKSAVNSGFQSAIILQTVYPFFNKTGFLIWKYVVVSLFNIGYMVVLFYPLKKKAFKNFKQR